jgi:hypothetical protein
MRRGNQKFLMSKPRADGFRQTGAAALHAVIIRRQGAENALYGQGGSGAAASRKQVRVCPSKAVRGGP